MMQECRGERVKKTRVEKKFEKKNPHGKKIPGDLLLRSSLAFSPRVMNSMPALILITIVAPHTGNHVYVSLNSNNCSLAMINKIVPRYRAHNYCSTKHKGHIFQFKAPPPPWWQRFSIDPAHSTLHKSSIERRTGRRPPYINDRSPLGVSVFRSCAIIPITCMVALRAPIISKMPADKKECTRVRKCGEREKRGSNGNARHALSSRSSWNMA